MAVTMPKNQTTEQDKNKKQKTNTPNKNKTHKTQNRHCEQGQSHQYGVT
jgi:hypothetical protein